MTLLSPFPYFGGKRSIAADVWQRLGTPTQYIEPFCGSAAVLLAAPQPASLEVVCDASGFIANFWRAVKHHPAEVARWADYPVSHIDLGARHVWLMQQVERVGAELHDCDWPGDAKVAGWWLWGQCCWIGSGWCDWDRAGAARRQRRDGAIGIGKVPQYNETGRGILSVGAQQGAAEMMTSTGRAAWHWLHKLATRLERVRVIHGDWTRCLNNNFGGDDTAVFLDPPYRGFEQLYGASTPAADAAEEWSRNNSHLRIALCGHQGDYNLPGWDSVEWSRGRLTYSGNRTTDKECVWYSPPCLPREQRGLFDGLFAQVAVE